MPKPGMKQSAPIGRSTGISQGSKAQNASLKTTQLVVKGFAVPVRNTLPGVSGAAKVVSAIPSSAKNAERSSEANALYGAKNAIQGATRTAKASGRVVVSGAGLVASRVATKKGKDGAVKAISKVRLVRRGVSKTVGTVSSVAGRTANVAKSLTEHNGNPEEAIAKTAISAGEETAGVAVDASWELTKKGVKKAGKKEIEKRTQKKVSDQGERLAKKAGEKATKQASKVAKKGSRATKAGAKVAKAGTKAGTATVKTAKVATKATAKTAKVAAKASAKTAMTVAKTAGVAGAGASATAATGGLAAPVVIAAGVAYVARHAVSATIKASAKAAKKVLEATSEVFEGMFNFVDKTKTYVIGAIVVLILFFCGAIATLFGTISDVGSEIIEYGGAVIAIIQNAAETVANTIDGFLDEQWLKLNAEEVIKGKVTAYTATGNPTSQGLKTKRGLVAVNPDQIPYGSVLYIPGYGWAEAADTGSFYYSIDASRVVDVFVDGKGNGFDGKTYSSDKDEAVAWGVQDLNVYVMYKNDKAIGDKDNELGMPPNKATGDAVERYLAIHPVIAGAISGTGAIDNNLYAPEYCENFGVGKSRYNGINTIHTSGYYGSSNFAQTGKGVLFKGSALPNCTAWVWARVYQVHGISLSSVYGATGTGGKKISKVPFDSATIRAGDYLIWDGKHVAFVESVNGDTYVITESGQWISNSELKNGSQHYWYREVTISGRNNLKKHLEEADGKITHVAQIR